MEKRNSVKYFIIWLILETWWIVKRISYKFRSNLNLPDDLNEKYIASYKILVQFNNFFISKWKLIEFCLYLLAWKFRPSVKNWMIANGTTRNNRSSCHVQRMECRKSEPNPGVLAQRQKFDWWQKYFFTHWTKLTWRVLLWTFYW